MATTDSGITTQGVEMPLHVNVRSDAKTGCISKTLAATQCAMGVDEVDKRGFLVEVHTESTMPTRSSRRAPRSTGRRAAMTLPLLSCEPHHNTYPQHPTTSNSQKTKILKHTKNIQKHPPKKIKKKNIKNKHMPSNACTCLYNQWTSEKQRETKIL